MQWGSLWCWSETSSPRFKSLMILSHDRLILPAHHWTHQPVGVCLVLCVCVSVWCYVCVRLCVWCYGCVCFSMRMVLCVCASVCMVLYVFVCVSVGMALKCVGVCASVCLALECVCLVLCVCVCASLCMVLCMCVFFYGHGVMCVCVGGCWREGDLLSRSDQRLLKPTPRSPSSLIFTILQGAGKGLGRPA